jgi:hypothetical protein
VDARRERGPFIPALIVSLLAGAAGAAEGPPRRPAGVSLSLNQARIWQRAPAQTTDLTILSGSYDLTRSVTLFGRLGLVDNRSGAEAKAWGVANPSVGASFGVPLTARLRLGLVFGSTLPVGSGGGDAPARPTALSAMLSGTDWGGPMFGPNHIDVYEGFSLTAIPRSFTFRIKSTLHPAMRVRGRKTDTLGPRVIFTSSGLLASRALTRQMSVFVELSETRFLNHPPFLQDDPSSRVDRYAAAGVSTDFHLGGARRLQPAVLYARGLDAPKTGRRFQLIELDVQVGF